MPRAQLVTAFAGALVDARGGLIDAGPGFGKTWLLRQVCAAWPHATLSWPAALVADPLVALADAVEQAVGQRALDSEGVVARICRALEAMPQPLLVAIDDAHLLGRDAGELCRLVDQLPSRHRVVCATRGDNPWLADGWQAQGPVVTGHALLLDEAEVALAMRGADVDGATAWAATGGWAEGVALLRGRPESARTPSVATLIAELRRRCEVLPPAHAAALRQALALPVWTRTVLEGATQTPGLLGSLLEARLPLTWTRDGGWFMPPALRDALPRDPLSPRVARRAAERYRRHARWREAFEASRMAGDLRAAVAVLERMPGSDADTLSLAPADLAALRDEDLRAHPVAALRLLRGVELGAVSPAVDAFGERLARVFGAGTPGGTAAGAAGSGAAPAAAGETAQALQAERLRRLLHAGHTTAARAAAVKLMPAAAGDQARARLLEVLGRAARRRASDDDLLVAHRLLCEAMGLWRRLDEPGRVAELRLHVARVDLDLGRTHQALLRAQAVRLALPPRSPLWPVALLAQADALFDLARVEEARALLAQMGAATALGAPPLVRAGVVLRRARAAAAGGEWSEVMELLPAIGEELRLCDGSIACGIRAETAELWARVGDDTAARARLREAAELVAEPPVALRIAEAAVEARLGDPRLAGRLLACAQAPPRERWRLKVLGAYAALRAEQPWTALLEDGLRQAAAIGQPFAPFARERELFLRLTGDRAREAAGERR